MAELPRQEALGGLRLADLGADRASLVDVVANCKLSGNIVFLCMDIIGPRLAA